MASIYGIFEGERCLYVGCTLNPEQRRANHILNFGPKCEFRLIREVGLRWAKQTEKKFIREYRAKGEAEHNKNGVVRSPLRALPVSRDLHMQVRVIAASEAKKIHEVCDELFGQIAKDRFETVISAQ